MPEASRADKFKAVTTEMLRVHTDLQQLLDRLGVQIRDTDLHGVDTCGQHDLLDTMEKIQTGLLVQAQMTVLLAGYHADAVHKAHLPWAILYALGQQTHELEKWFATIVDMRNRQEAAKKTKPEPEVRKADPDAPPAEGWLDRIIRATRR